MEIIAIIFNASAGAPKYVSDLDKIAETLEKKNVQYAFFLAEKGENLFKLAKRAISLGHKKIVAVGGDGTISAVASALVGSDAHLGILPHGTFNHFAKDLKIPLEFEQAIDTIINGEPKKVDVAEVNNLIFINNSGIGLYPHLVIQREDSEAKGVARPLALLIALFKVLKRYPNVRIRLHIDEQEIVRESPLVFIGNNIYKLQGFNIGVRERIDEEHLNLHLAHRLPRLGLLKLAFKFLLGKRGDDKVENHVVKEIWIETRQKFLHVAIDGEVFLLKTPLHYRIIPGALKVLAPKA